jgi:hypothetical protein
MPSGCASRVAFFFMKTLALFFYKSKACRKAKNKKPPCPTGGPSAKLCFYKKKIGPGQMSLHTLAANVFT